MKVLGEDGRWRDANMEEIAYQREKYWQQERTQATGDKVFLIFLLVMFAPILVAIFATAQ